MSESTGKILRKYFRYAIPKVRGIVHVGAHLCQEQSCYDLLKIKNVIWIDGNIENHIENGHNFINAILADNNDKRNFYISDNSNGGSSSLFPFKEITDVYKGRISIKEIREVIPETLDRIFFKTGIDRNNYNALIMHTNGADLLILKGAQDFIPYLDYIGTYFYWRELYTGVPFESDIDSYMDKIGFNPKYKLPWKSGYGQALYVKNTIQEEKKMNKFLQKCLNYAEGKIKGVLFLGSHRMQERQQFLDNRIINIIWVDALEDIVNKNRKEITEYESALCYTISDKDNETVKFHVSSNDGLSSSLLPFPEIQIHNSNVNTIKIVEVKTITVDTLLQSIYMPAKNYNFLCMDIHGIETKVLDGAVEYLKTCNYVYTEINFIEAYQGCCLYPEFDRYMLDHGFRQVFYYQGKKEYGYLFYERAK